MSPMRKGFSDARIVASEVTAACNIRLFVEFHEFAEGHLNAQSLHAAFQIAADLNAICRQHEDERLAGTRRW